MEMKIFILLFLPLIMISCSGIEQYLLEPKKSAGQKTSASTNEGGYSIDSEYDINKMDQIIRSASFDVPNRKILMNPDEWIGKIISVSGIFSVKSSILLGSETIEIFGSVGRAAGGDLINYVIDLDHPLPEQTRIDQNVNLISFGREYRVFGSLESLKEYFSEGGYKKVIPTLKCYVIFGNDDHEFRYPLWVSNRFEVLPQGNVKVDSLKFKFPESK